MAAARDPRVRAAVALIPFIQAPRKPELRLTKEILVDALGRLLGREPATIPCAGSPASRAIMRTDGAAAWMANMAKSAPRFRNEVTVASLWNMGRYTTATAAAQVEVPLRVILAERDSITPAASVRAAFARRRGSNVELVTFPETHFELFEQHLDETVRLTVDWLVRHLVEGAPRSTDAARPIA
jgi:pimeloyl-ACP methyl ester carboxylesterase